MNYIQQLNAFWEKSESEQELKPTEIAVYMALFQINNKTGWKEKFRVVFGQVLSMTGISKNTYYKAVGVLVKGGYIEYEKGHNDYVVASFRIIVLYQNLVQQEFSNGVDEVNQEDSVKPILKPINNKPIKPINKIIEIDLVFKNDEFLNSDQEMVKVFKRWFDYKKEAKEKFKTTDSAITAFKNLKEISGENIVIAQQIVDKSIASGYKGLFPLKNNISQYSATNSNNAPGMSKVESLTKQFNAIKFTDEDEGLNVINY